LTAPSTAPGLGAVGTRGGPVRLVVGEHHRRRLKQRALRIAIKHRDWHALKQREAAYIVNSCCRFMRICIAWIVSRFCASNRDSASFSSCVR